MRTEANRSLSQFAVKLHGEANTRRVVLVHGYGCNQNVWRLMLPQLLEFAQVIAYDHIGSGVSDYKLYKPERYSTLFGYTDDLIEICERISNGKLAVIGHSVGATIAALACIRRPDLFSKLVMISPSPCFINQENYGGGFEKWELDQLMELMDSDYVSWVEYVTPILMGRQPVDAEGNLALMKQWFCQIDRDIAKHFARVTFYADHRRDFERIKTPTLMVHCTNDPFTPEFVGQFLLKQIVNSTLVKIQASGHCPHLTNPIETLGAIKRFCFEMVD